MNKEAIIVGESYESVSYTHLDVYKRQVNEIIKSISFYANGVIMFLDSIVKQMMVRRTQ
ncbi:hypothetical protein A5868_001941 [Enterococcus sp. 12F9_DIV0723]|uniref:hypothetical protein n=1 Tax=Enterococcus sp. 12F9_DIV0723 TaxID=1834169 RepID=UPI000B733D98|nr:hypothetical protein [Enterococcus sp. 12F9_DIV0723]OUZ17002.1 hypothetical protein A5868_001941 [Enterococcus sp. 12F9_DIV0723]